VPIADREATEARKFQDPHSFVFKDGREWLEGKDWDARRFELLVRCHGQCENIIGGHRCWRECADPHHVELRSIKRDDRIENLLALCRPCHRALDKLQREAKRNKR
jgi:hypothetical protein